MDAIDVGFETTNASQTIITHETFLFRIKPSPDGQKGHPKGQDEGVEMSASSTARIGVPPRESLDQPLASKAKAVLAAQAALTILLFYSFAFVSLAFLLALLLSEVVLVVVLLRFGLSGPVIRVMGIHLSLVPMLCRSLWLGSSAEYRVELGKQDAPRLFQIIEELSMKAGVAIPKSMYLEMHVNAWVRMNGFLRGKGSTALGIGYDLLASLCETEVRAVIAHEVTHAKLVQRGIKNWLKRGAGRAAQLAGGFAGLLANGRQKNETSEIYMLGFRLADWFARTARRQVAACLRQDEFEADAGAADLCGNAAMSSSLIRIEAASERASRLPWRDRVAQLQLGESFSDWLRQELAAPTEQGIQRAETDSNLTSGTGGGSGLQPVDQYSTHPSLEDRLRALGNVTQVRAFNSPPGLSLLADPDREAERLMAEIQRVTIRQEERDSKRLGRWLRKTRANAHIGGARTLGILVGSLAVIGSLIIAGVAGVSSGLMMFLGVALPVSAALFWFGGYRDRVALAIPDYTKIIEADRASAGFSPARMHELEIELKKSLEGQRRAGRRGRMLATSAYEALARCDYGRAYVAAHMCLKQHPKSVEGALAFAVAAAAGGQRDNVTWALRQLNQLTNISTPSTCWGAAWALVLCADYQAAEAFLRDALRGQRGNPTLLALLAVSESRRGKLQSAIGNARRACTPAAPGKEYGKLLINLLLDAGFPREAEERLAAVEAEAASDDDIKLALVRLNLMMRRPEAANDWAARLDRDEQSGAVICRLGGVYEAARRHLEAAQFFSESACTRPLSRGTCWSGPAGTDRWKSQCRPRSPAGGSGSEANTRGGINRNDSPGGRDLERAGGFGATGGGLPSMVRHAQWRHWTRGVRQSLVRNLFARPTAGRGVLQRAVDGDASRKPSAATGNDRLGNGPSRTATDRAGETRCARVFHAVNGAGNQPTRVRG